MSDPVYCDHCGEELKLLYVSVTELPFAVASANEGESAILCPTCWNEGKGPAR